MRRFLILLLIASFGAMPLTGVAKSMSAPAQDSEELQDMKGMKDMPCHQSAPKPADEPTSDCGYCKGASHCCAGFILPAPAFGPAVGASATRIASLPVLSAGIVLSPLEPPPLAL